MIERVEFGKSESSLGNLAGRSHGDLLAAVFSLHCPFSPAKRASASSMGNEKQRWRISFHKSREFRAQNRQPVAVPDEFLCPISGSIMADPVVVFSGHTFERSSVNACVSLSFNPRLPDGALADFSVVIPNLALKAAIGNWCCQNFVDPPQPVDSRTAAEIVRKLIGEVPKMELALTQSDVSVPSSEECVAPRTSFATPTPSRIWPSCYSSPSSCEAEVSGSEVMDEEDLVAKLENPAIDKQEEELVALRELTRTREESRAALCTPRLLSAIKAFIASKHQSLQVNATAVLVNLSLENLNKAKIVRSGFVQPLVDVLNGGTPEAADHAAGALFSLSIDEQNKAAIGVLGALAPLLHALRSDSRPRRHDSALALYHLSMVDSNRVKLTKLGAVQILLGIVKSGQMLSLVMLVLRNLACSPVGRAAMLDAGAVECFLGLLSLDGNQSSAVRKSCLSALYGLSYGGRRFKGAAKAAGAEEVVLKLENIGSERGKEMARRILDVLREELENDEVNWEELLDIIEDSTELKTPSC